MKPFNFFITLFLLIVTVGFLFFKDGFNKLQKGGNSGKSSNSEILMDRVNYLDYSEQNLASAQKNGKPVLFFAATIWCQTCQALEKEIKEKGDSLPSDVTILKVDYDNDREMKRKWGVITQHTLIQLDSNGNEINRWIGGNLDALIANLK